jgi:hypothetical protein
MACQTTTVGYEHALELLFANQGSTANPCEESPRKLKAGAGLKKSGYHWNLWNDAEYHPKYPRIDDQAAKEAPRNKGSLFKRLPGLRNFRLQFKSFPQPNFRECKTVLQKAGLFHS